MILSTTDIEHRRIPGCRCGWWPRFDRNLGSGTRTLMPKRRGLLLEMRRQTATAPPNALPCPRDALSTRCRSGTTGGPSCSMIPLRPSQRLADRPSCRRQRWEAVPLACHARRFEVVRAGQRRPTEGRTDLGVSVRKLIGGVGGSASQAENAGSNPVTRSPPPLLPENRPHGGGRRTRLLDLPISGTDGWHRTSRDTFRTWLRTAGWIVAASSPG